MRPREVRHYLFDILQACDFVARVTEGRGLKDYLEDDLLRAAVERQFIMIGEAQRQALDRDPSLAERIPDTSLIIAFRNRLVHAYPYIDDQTVWGVIERHLPRLRQQVRTVLNERQ